MTQANTSERAEWEALLNEPRLNILPKEALVASIKSLAGRLLEMTQDEVPQVEVTSGLIPAPTTPTPVRRSAARNVSDAHLQTAFITEAREAMGQPSQQRCMHLLGKEVVIVFNVDKRPMQGVLTRVINHPTNAPTYLVLDNKDDVLYPLNSVQSIEEVDA